MPELPDITVYIEALERRIVGQTLEDVRIRSPLLLRSFDPPIEAVRNREVTSLRRLGKRIAIGLDGDLWLVLHLMIAGRLQWSSEPRGRMAGGRNGLAAFDFSNGTLTLTEAGSKKRASLHFVASAQLSDHQPAGLEPLDITCRQFVAQLRSQNRTLKRALTMPSLFSGIGNAYSDEILHRAKLSPIMLTSRLTDEQAARLYEAMQS